jgi:serine/threonine protein kinase
MFGWFKRLFGRQPSHRSRRRRASEPPITRRNPPAQLPPKRPLTPSLRIVTAPSVQLTGNTATPIQANFATKIDQKAPPLLGDSYEIAGIVGQGGFGIVYLVYHRTSGAIHGLKTYHDRWAQGHNLEAEFRKEAQLWIELGRHPNLVQAEFVEKIGERLYLAMEFIAPDEQGRNTLAHFLESKEVDAQQALRWGMEICRGMEHAMARGVRSHRDLKPSNILISRTLEAKVSDFGIASLCGDNHGNGEPSGTPSHMSPEQFRTVAGCDQRSDIYAFGVILYQMLHGGKLPFEATLPRTQSEGWRRYWDDFRQLHATAKAPEFDSPLSNVIQRCMAKRPEKRYQTFAALRLELEAILFQVYGTTHAMPEIKVDELANLINKGLSLYHIGKQKEALDSFQQACERNPEASLAWQNCGGILMQLQRFEEAQACFDRLQQLNPLQGTIMCGLLLQRQGKRPEAEACFRRVLAAEPNHLLVTLDLGVVLAEQERWNEAKETFERATELEPGSASAWHGLGNIHHALKDYTKALHCFDRALHNDPCHAAAANMKSATMWNLGLGGTTTTQ